MTCNDSRWLWWSSALSTMPICRWTCSPPSALPKLFAIFLKYLKFPTPVTVKKVELALNCFEFPPSQRRSSLQQLKQNIYFTTIWRKGEQGRHIFLPWDKSCFACTSWNCWILSSPWMSLFKQHWKDPCMSGWCWAPIFPAWKLLLPLL